MHNSLFLKLFPPPKFLSMPYVGLDISDDSICFIEYSFGWKGVFIDRYAIEDMPLGLIEGGDIKNDKDFISFIKNFSAKYKLSRVKVSVPEEKAYLFETEVPDARMSHIAQNIEFKLEENVPLSVADAVFYFDISQHKASRGSLRASVSVVPKSYIEHYISLLRSAGLDPIAFETSPKAIAKTISDPTQGSIDLIVHSMNKKTGIYIVSGGTVYFTSTFNLCAGDAEAILGEVKKVCLYWSSRTDVGIPISRTILVGNKANELDQNIHKIASSDIPVVSLADVWGSFIDFNSYIPPISKDQSLSYATSAGLAMPSI